MKERKNPKRNLVSDYYYYYYYYYYCTLLITMSQSPWDVEQSFSNHKTNRKEKITGRHVWQH